MADEPDAGAGVVLALSAGALGLAVLTALVALLLGAAWWEAGALALVVPWTASLVAVGGLVLHGRLRRAAVDERPAGPAGATQASTAFPTTSGPSTALRQATVVVEELERELYASCSGGAVGEMLPLAAELHSARLHLASVLLREQGRLPQDMKDELLVQHRGFTRLLEGAADGQPGLG